MANIKQLTQQVDDLQAALDSEQEQIKAAIDKLQQTVDALEVLVTEGGTEEERQALSDKIQAVIVDLQGTIPDEESTTSTTTEETTFPEESTTSSTTTEETTQQV